MLANCPKTSDLTGTNLFLLVLPQTFCGLFIASMKSTLNSEYFEKKDQSHSLSITEIIDCETGSY